ncbi:MAG: hypothetical protein FJ279_32775, partial [Planctomycetes bacterium]|nr:hypothetical protein [Planctomycetota bacterium]
MTRPLSGESSFMAHLKRSCLLIVLLALACGNVAWPAERAKPAVLFVNFQMQDFHLAYFKQFLREMHVAGYEVDYATFEQLDVTQFAKFHVIVYLNVPNWDSVTHEPTEAFKAQAAALRKHLAAGGGLLVMSHPGAQRLPVLWHLLTPL